LQKKAEEATKLKDEVDEYRHLADRVQRTENANEKYRKKLEEMAGVRRHLKELEDQNSELIDRNASLEKEHAKVLEYKPLIENYKEQIADLTRRNGSLIEETGTLKYNLEQIALQLKGLEEARTRSAEEIELYREKVEELELEVNGSVSEGKEGNDVPLDDELEDTLRGTTMTDLKLRIHQLSRDLKAAKEQSGEGSNVLVLENLLDDSQRMKQRYETDYWKEYRLRLQRDGELEKIRSGGEGSLADGPEAARALRLRLAEVITDLDSLRAEHAELSVKHESNEKELADLRADLVLVDKDKLDILASLRSTVSQEKAELEGEIKTLQQDLRSAQELEKSMGSQIQGLLMDKISLMEGEAAGRAEGLAREPSLSAAEQERLDAKNKELKVRLSDLEDKMRKAKTFIRQQDKLLQEARKGAAIQNGGLENGVGAKADEELRRENVSDRLRSCLASSFHR
jgi:protein HOOK3